MHLPGVSHQNYRFASFVRSTTDHYERLKLLTISEKKSDSIPSLPEKDQTLDGLRGFAMLSVILYHLVGLPLKAAAPPLVPPFLIAVLYKGRVGVTLFFTLSGFLLVNGGLDQGHKNRYLLTFWVKRIFRIVPLYSILLGSFIGAVLLSSSGMVNLDSKLDGVIPVWSYLLFCQNLLMLREGDLGCAWLDVTWSLAIEMQFYLLIGFIIYRARGRALERILWLLFFIAIASRFVLLDILNFSERWLFLFLPCRLDSFMIGGIIAIYIRKPTFASNLERRHIIAFTILLGSASISLAFSSPIFDQLSRNYTVPFLYTFHSFGCAALLYLCVTNCRIFKQLFSNRILIEASRLSYFAYLFHLPLAYCLYSILLHSEPSPCSISGIAVLFLTLSILYFLASLSGLYFERPLLDYSKSICLRLTLRR